LMRPATLRRMDLPPDVKARRAVEDRAIRLGNKRAQLERQREKVIEDAVELMSDAERVGVSVARLADLIHVDRPNLYRWRNAVAIHRADREEHERGDA
jgi:hypothetical protein